MLRGVFLPQPSLGGSPQSRVGRRRANTWRGARAGYSSVRSSWRIAPNVVALEDTPSTISCGQIGLGALNLTVPFVVVTPFVTTGSFTKLEPKLG